MSLFCERRDAVLDLLGLRIGLWEAIPINFLYVDNHARVIGRLDACLGVHTSLYVNRYPVELGYHCGSEVPCIQP